MLTLEPGDRRPLYEQIKENIKTLIIRGALQENDKIPSVRELSASLTINPNTIQKAYRELEMEGYIYSHQGKGNFVAPLIRGKNTEKLNQLFHQLDKIAKEMLYLGCSKESLLKHIQDL